MQHANDNDTTRMMMANENRQENTKNTKKAGNGLFGF
jgi:hypothetical protein